MAQETQPSAWFIRGTLVAAFALFVGSAAIIYYRFSRTPETNCNIMVLANRTLAGSEVSVQRVVRDGRPPEPLKVVLAEQNAYRARFFLASGTYRVRLVKADGALLLDDDPFIPPGRYCTYDLARLYPETPETLRRPAAQNSGTVP